VTSASFEERDDVDANETALRDLRRAFPVVADVLSPLAFYVVAEGAFDGLGSLVFAIWPELA